MAPQVMHASAKLNIGRKKIKWRPPQMGTHSGSVVSMIGK